MEVKNKQHVKLVFDPITQFRDNTYFVRTLKTPLIIPENIDYQVKLVYYTGWAKKSEASSLFPHILYNFDLTQSSTFISKDS
jgi:hypothetical protein